MVIIKENCRLCQLDLGIMPLNDDVSQLVQEITKIKVDDAYSTLLPTSICLECNKILTETTIYIRSVQKVNKYLCDYIEKNYSNIDNVDTYAEKYEVKEINFTCNKCSTTFDNKQELINHLLDHREQPERFLCIICCKEYTRKSNYTAHLKSHPNLCCVKCHIFFGSPDEREKHTCTTLDKKRKKREDPLESEQKSDPNQSDIKKEESKNNYKFQCVNCCKQFKDEKVLKKHLKKHHKYRFNEKNCTKIDDALNSLKSHSLVHEGSRPYLCVVCGKDFISKKSLVCHEKIHSVVKGYRCNLCNLGFSVRSNLRSHIKKYHEHVRYRCSQCPKEFMSKCTLDRHEKIHIGIKEFKCDKCTSAFYTKKELAKHQIYHQGIKSHKCEHCFKTFFERHHLIIHIRSHKGEKPFVCGVPNCTKSFCDKQKLRRHEKTVHRPKEKVSVSSGDKEELIKI